jgi:hypothetical protein
MSSYFRILLSLSLISLYLQIPMNLLNSLILLNLLYIHIRLYIFPLIWQYCLISLNPKAILFLYINY